MDSFEKIYRRYAPALRKFVVGMIKDAALAEDIVQNIFMRMLSGKMDFRSDESLRNWLYVCACNEVISTLRSKWKSGKVEISEGLIQDADDPASESLSTAMLSALKTMPPKRAEVFRLCKMEHLTNEEVAQRLGISVRTVEKHLQLAYTDIRQHMS